MTLSRRLAKAKSLLLGLFFLSQVAYLLIYNFVQFLPRELPEEKVEVTFEVQERGRLSRYEAIQQPNEMLGALCDRWSEATGFWQGWKMFTIFYHQSVFPVIILRMADGTEVRIEPEFMPADPDGFLRFTDSRHRLFNFETRMTAGYTILPVSQKDHPEFPAAWRKLTLDWVRRMNRSTAAYLAWRTQQYLKQHPDSKMPTSVELAVRIIPTPDPGMPRMLTGLPDDTLPLARWRPGMDDPEYLPLEAWNAGFDAKPTPDEGFVRLKRSEMP